MADWGNVYAFDSSDDLTSRVRRLERGRQYLRAGNLVSPSGGFQGMPTGLLDSFHNRIDIVSGLNTKGSIPPAGVTGNFGFTATSTSITIYWDGTNGSAVLAILRADGTAVQIPSNNMTVTGLSPSTTYGFLPFWSVFNNCGIGFVVGNAGTPAFAFTAAAQNVQSSTQQSLSGREPLSGGFITFATPASGTTSGTGTSAGYGGHPGTCIMLGTHVEPFASGQEYITLHHRQTDWVNVAIEGFGNLSCTPNHPLYTPEKQQRADQFKAGDWILTSNGEMKLDEVRMFYKDCTKMEVKMPIGHLFFANGFLSHNNKLNLT